MSTISTDEMNHSRRSEADMKKIKQKISFCKYGGKHNQDKGALAVTTNIKGHE